MEDRFYVKVCGLTDSKNINDVIALGVDFIGFIFYEESKRYIGDDLDANFIKSLTGKVNKVGVYVDEELDTILEDAEDLELGYIQLHGNETPAFCKAVRKKAKVIKAFGIDAKFDFEKLKKYEKDVDFFLFDTKSKEKGGSGEKFDWKLLKKYKLKVPVMLSGGITPHDGKAIKNLPYKFIKAVDINSKFEEKPGLKDVWLIEAFLELLKL